MAQDQSRLTPEPNVSRSRGPTTNFSHRSSTHAEQRTPGQLPHITLSQGDSTAGANPGEPYDAANYSSVDIGTRTSQIPRTTPFRFNSSETYDRSNASIPEDEHEHSPESEAVQKPPSRNNWTEDRPLERTLGTWNVAALIMNKMIGTGIFTAPGLILSLTGSKSVSIVLWIVGGIYSMLSLSIYLEYGLNFPFNGGDLIYVDEVWPIPELLSTVLYSGFFIAFGNTAGNSVAFAKYVLAAATGVEKTSQFDKRLVNLIAVTILAVICFLHYFSSKMGLFLNRLLAWYKIGLLTTVFIAGAAARHQQGSGLHDWYVVDTKSPRSSFDTLSALIYIFYSYQGWENANYVAGEIKFDKVDTLILKRGAYLAVALTTLLYVLATVGYYLACPSAEITQTNSDLGMAQFFAPRAFSGHSAGFEICIALSAVGNLVAVVYTSSKVKQCIARQRIIPFHKFFAADDIHFATPGGALVLHWICTFVLIVAMPNTTDGYGFIIGIFTYGHLIIGIFVGIGILKLAARMEHLPDTRTWDYKLLRWSWLRYTVAFLFVGINLLTLVVAARPHGSGDIARFWWPVVLGCVAAGSGIYWLVLWLLQDGRLLSKKLGIDVIAHHGYDDVNADFQQMMLDARKDGSNRRMEYMVRGKLWKTLDRFGKDVRDRFYRFLW